MVNYTKPTRHTSRGCHFPLLANISLHGMENALGIRYSLDGRRKPGKSALVRYADDFVVMCPTEKDAIRAQGIISDFLSIRGLQLSPEKTRVVKLQDGFHFLGFNVRIYQTARTKSGWITLIRPSKKSVSKIRERLREVMLEHIGHNVDTVVKDLNPIIRDGHTTSERRCQVTRSPHKLDSFMFKRELRFLRRAPK